MSDLKKLISYLRLYRRSERAEQHESKKNLLQLAPVLDGLDFTTTDDNDLVIIPKERISNSFYYVSLSLIPNQSILLISREQGVYTYYVKHPVVLTYKKLPGGNWIQEEELPEDCVEMEESFQDLYFDLRRKIVFRVLLESAFLFPDWFLYAPEEDAVFKQFRSQETLRLEGSYDLGYEEMSRDIFGVIISPDSIKESISVIQRRYKKREAVFFKNPRSGKVYLIPRFDFSKPHRLFYPYLELGVPFSSAVHRFDEPALGFTFNHHHALLTYLNETLFHYAEDRSFFDTPPRTTFLKEYVIYVSDLLQHNDPIISLTVFLYVPSFVFKEIDINYLWMLLEQLSSEWINERSLPKESIVLQLLKAIYGHYKEKQADRFLLELLDRQVDNKSIIQQLFDKIDGDNFEQLVRFLWGVWKRSLFIYPDIETNPDYKDTNGPIFLPYRSEKQFGFYFTSLSVEFIEKDKLEVIYGTNSYKTIDLNLPEKIGLSVPKEVNDIFKPLTDLLPDEIKIEKKETVTYHPFYPVYLIKTDGEQDFVFEDLKNESLMPAFVLQANELKSFWNNVATGGEYAVDILTTISGVGNIAKFRHLSKIATRAEKLRFVSQTGKNLSKAKATVAGGAAVVEISSGTINALIKLTGFNDTPFGKALQDFLFYLELLSLSGELTVAIHNGLRINAKKLVDKPEDAAKLEKQLEDVVVKGELDEVGKKKALEELRRVAGMAENIKTAKNVDEFLASAERLAKLKITSKTALKYLDEALEHFNYKVENGVVKQIGDHNCIEVVKVVDEYLKTGKITKTKYSEFQNINELEKIYNGTFLTYKIPSLKNVMKEGEIGIIFGDKGIGKKGHVFNVIKKDQELLFIDGQIGKAANLRDGYISFKYLKTN